MKGLLCVGTRQALRQSSGREQKSHSLTLQLVGEEKT